MKVVVVAVLALVVGAVSGLAGGRAASGFRDVAPAHPAYRAVQTLSDDGVMTGFADGSFRGNRPVTRYELAVTLDRLLVHLQAQAATAASKRDIDSMQKLIDGLEDEVVALEQRVDRLSSSR